MDMCRGVIADITVEGCSRWRYKTGGKEEDQKGDSEEEEEKKMQMTGKDRGG